MTVVPIEADLTPFTLVAALSALAVSPPSLMVAVWVFVQVCWDRPSGTHGCN